MRVGEHHQRREDADRVVFGAGERTRADDLLFVGR